MKSIGSALNHSKMNYNNFSNRKLSIGSALNHSKMNYNNFSNMRKFSIGSALNHSKMNYNTFSNKKPEPSELFFEIFQKYHMMEYLMKIILKYHQKKQNY